MITGPVRDPVRHAKKIEKEAQEPSPQYSFRGTQNNEDYGEHYGVPTARRAPTDFNLMQNTAKYANLFSDELLRYPIWYQAMAVSS